MVLKISILQLNGVIKIIIFVIRIITKNMINISINIIFYFINNM